MPKLSTQEKYVRCQKRTRRLITLARLALFIAFLILWEFSAQTGMIDSFIFSSPSRMAETFLRMWKTESLGVQIGITLLETLTSFLLVTVLSLLTAILLWLCPRFSKILEPYLVILNSLPKSALAPLLIVWLGANMRTIIVAGLSVAIFGSIISLYTGFQEISPDKLKLIYTLGGTRRHALFKVILPASIPYLLSNMKVNIGLCLVGVIIGEFIGARQGLGYLIIYGSQVFKLNMVMMSIVILCIIAMALYQAIHLIEKCYLKKL